MRSLLVFCACALLLGCSQDGPDASPVNSIVVAVLPDQSPEALRSRHTPLLDYLAQETSLDIKFVIPADYADLVSQFDGGGIDLAWFGGLTYIQAEARSEAEPLAFRDVDMRFTSCYLARGDDARSSMREFEGAAFGFGPRLSTSGHLMPRYFLERAGVFPDKFFSSTQHSAGHDETAIWVRDGTIDIGVANCVIVQSLFDDGRISADEVRVVETTPHYSDYVWAVKASMDKHTRAVLLDAFMALDATDPLHLTILQSQGANAYMPAARGNFELVRRAAEISGIFAGDNDP